MDHFFNMINDPDHRELIREAYERGLVLHSADAVSAKNHGYWVPTEKLASFVRFILTKKSKRF